MKISEKIKDFFINPRLPFLIATVFIAIISTVGGTLIMTQDTLSDYKMIGYVLLGLMAVSLSYSIFGIVLIYPKVKDSILKWAQKHPRINKLFSQYGFTALITTAAAIFVSLAFAVYNGSIAFVIKSIWFGALAAYYIVLIILRGSILAYHGKRRISIRKGQSETQTLINDSKMYRTCGIMLLLLPICLSFAILQMVRAGDSFVHTGITIYVYAIYAFFKIITAIYSFIKERHNTAMTIMAIKNIKLADAMVSILALQTAMFREFNGEFADKTAKTMNAVTGLIVCILTVAVGVYMIIRASLRIKKLKQEQGATIDEQSEDNSTKNDI